MQLPTGKSIPRVGDFAFVARVKVASLQSLPVRLRSQGAEPEIRLGQGCQLGSVLKIFTGGAAVGGGIQDGEGVSFQGVDHQKGSRHPILADAAEADSVVSPAPAAEGLIRDLGERSVEHAGHEKRKIRPRFLQRPAPLDQREESSLQISMSGDRPMESQGICLDLPEILELERRLLTPQFGLGYPACSRGIALESRVGHTQGRGGRGGSPLGLRGCGHPPDDGSVFFHRQRPARGLQSGHDAVIPQGQEFRVTHF
ncbi:MAG: hypothetical protein EBT56_14025 [Betaproteobacteria bacterium]|nr:hypothetical protein [Betaproteobacteria bacterium]